MTVTTAKNGYTPSKYGRCSRFLRRNDMYYIIVYALRMTSITNQREVYLLSPDSEDSDSEDLEESVESVDFEDFVTFVVAEE